MPFGEAFVDEHTARTEMPFKFNCKEQDAETGLFYYGARYYEPGECRFYGNDPLLEKYPDMSPFVYTFNSPVKFVDPDGRDGYLVDEQGNISPIKNDKVGGQEFDVLYNKGKYESGDKQYDQTGKKAGLKLDKNIAPELLKRRSETAPVGNIDGTTEERSINFVKMSNEENSKKLFFFLADNSSAEWSYQANEGSLYIVGKFTDPDIARANAVTYFNIKGFDLASGRYYYHSHGGTSNDDIKPSNSDNRWAQSRPNMKFYLYVPKLTKKLWNSFPGLPKIDYEPSKIYKLPY